MTNPTGRRTINTIKFYEVDSTPASGLGLNAPVGSVASATDGSGLYVKTTASNTGWSSTGGGGGSGANQQLSNLNNVAVNTHLIPAIDDGYRIGTPQLRWKDGYFSNIVNIGGNNSVQNGATPNLWVSKDFSGQTTASFMNSTAGGMVEIILGQAHDISDGNYTGIFNMNSGHSTDGLFEPGTSGVGANSSLATGKLLLYVEAVQPIVFATGGHQVAHEKMRITTTQVQTSANIPLNVGNGVIGNEMLFVSSASGGYTATVKNTNSAANSILKVENDNGDDLLFESIGTLNGSANFGFANTARSGIVSYNGLGSGLSVGTFSSQPLVFHTGNVFRGQFAATGNLSIGTTSDLGTLGVDNGADAESIFVARDNGNTVFTIANDGYTQIANIAAFQVQAKTPAQITSNQNNYDPGLATFYRLSSDAPRNITGIGGGFDGRYIVLSNTGAQNIVLQNQNAGSLTTNRIITGTGADVTLAGDNSATLIYDNTTQRWRITATH